MSFHTVSRCSEDTVTMNENLEAFRNGFIRTSIKFLAFGGILLVRLFCPRLFLRFLDWDSSLSRRLGLPAGWIARSRRFSEGRGSVVLLSTFVLIFLLLMCFNLGAYYHFRDRLGKSAPPNKPAAGNAGNAPQLTIGHHRLGVPEPGR